MGRKPRLPISGTQQPLKGNPFENLELGGLPEGPATAPEMKRAPRKSGRVVLRREKAGRGGKTVVVVSGFERQHSDAEIERLAREARHACGCGGTVSGREIELQGDRPGKVREFFEAKGFRVDGVA